MLEALGHENRQAMAVSTHEEDGYVFPRTDDTFLIDAIDDETRGQFVGIVLEDIGYRAVEALINGK